MFEPIISKRCSHCKEIKPLSKFYKNRQKKDGHEYQCKDCYISHQRFYRQSAKGKEAVKRYAQGQKFKQTQKRYEQSAKGKEAHKRYDQGEKGKNTMRKKYLQVQKLHPDHVLAWVAVNNAIRVGKLPRPDSLKCAYCPNPAKEYHHYFGYAPEHVLDVLPACTKCHQAMNIRPYSPETLY